MCVWVCAYECGRVVQDPVVPVLCEPPAGVAAQSRLAKTKELPKAVEESILVCVCVCVRLHPRTVCVSSVVMCVCVGVRRI